MCRNVTRCAGQDSNRELPEYKSEALLLEPDFWKYNTKTDLTWARPEHVPWIQKVWDEVY